MTAYVSAASGSKDVATNWTPNGVPTIGDTITSIVHNITCSTNWTIGTSPIAGTNVLTVSTGGSISVSGAGIKFAIRGDALLDNASVTMNAGTILEIDGSVSAVAYKFHISGAHNQANARLNLNGILGTRVTVQSNAGGPNGTIDDGTGPWLNGGLQTATFADYLRIGSAALPVLFSVNTGGSMSVTDCTMTSGGKWSSTYNISGDSTLYNFQRCLWKTTLATESFRTTGANNYVSGTRTIDSCDFDKLIEFYTGTQFTITNNTFQNFDSTDGNWLLFDKNMYVKTVMTDSVVAGGTSNCVFAIDNPGGVNPHFVQSGNFARNFVHVGDVFQFNGTDAQGDCFLTATANPVSAITITITNSICLPSSLGGNNSGTPLTFFGAQPNITVIYERNTYIMGTQGFAASETGAGTTGKLTFRSNLAWDTSARGYACQSTGVAGASDLLPVSADRNNNTFNYLAGSNGNGYNNMVVSTGTLGSTDIHVDPLFRDRTVTIEKWDLSLGGAGTMASTWANMRKRNDPTQSYNASYTVANLLSYIRNGYTSLNLALKGTGFAGVDIGAQAIGGYIAEKLVRAGIVASIANILAAGGTAEQLNKVGVPGVLATKLASGSFTAFELMALGINSEDAKFLANGGN